MGWWAITGPDGGLLTRGLPTGMYNGDGPADILEPALKKVIEEYQVEWGRKPFLEEVQAALNFVACLHLLERRETPQAAPPGGGRPRIRTPGGGEREGSWNARYLALVREAETD
jgi:hypothetical protein